MAPYAPVLQGLQGIGQIYRPNGNHIDLMAAGRIRGIAVYDAALEARVRRVQSQFGLLPDGIVGPETQLVLSSRDRTGPRLARQPQ